MTKKFEISKFDGTVQGDLNLAVEQGRTIMDKLQEQGIVEATFSNKTHFKADKNHRAIASENILLMESETDITVRIPKEDHTIDEIINTKTPQPTQKLIGAYTGTSQSTVSKKKK